MTKLSPRQLECTILAGRGLDAGEIASLLGISKETARRYLTEARRSYGVKNKMQLVTRGLRDGLFDLDDLL